MNSNIDFTGITGDAKAALLDFLDPLEEASNNRLTKITCLIGFNFSSYNSIASKDPGQADTLLAADIISALNALNPKLSDAISTAKLENESLEFFFFPVPSVATLRDLFQSKIGWTP